MSPSKNIVKRQPYPRGPDGYLADIQLFPHQAPRLSEAQIRAAITTAFARTLLNKKGEHIDVNSTPEKTLKKTLRHLLERGDPILSPYFYSLCPAEEIFLLDAASHEMQTLRMKIGWFYQFLAKELMKKSMHVDQISDGMKEGDIFADVKVPRMNGGILRIYMSVKKSSDTVGGQDIHDAIRRLEKIALTDKNLNAPYLCVLFHASPTLGKSKSFESDRYFRRTQDGQEFSPNAEFWGPHFFFPYITGRSPAEIYKMCREEIAAFFPIHSLLYKKDCSELLTKRLKSLGILQKNGRIDPELFYDNLPRLCSGET